MTNPRFSWFDDFAKGFDSPDIRIWPENSEGVPNWYGWESRHLDDVTSPQEFVDRSAALKAIFDGAMYIQIGPSYRRLDLDEPRADEESDSKFVRCLPFPADVTVEPFSSLFVDKKVGYSEYPLANPIGFMIFLARYDMITRGILKYTGVQGLSYLTLYAFRDWMKSGGWTDERISSEAGWSKSQLNDFTNTANNPAYLGPFSRHGGTAPLPKRPMTLEAADEPIRKAIRAFLNDRAQLADLSSKWEALVE